jgi:ribosomal 50S subunit-recycling heat shock protein
MRLDKFLKVSRLIKRRTVANEVSSQGRVFINDKLAKPSSEVKQGDILRLEYYNKTLITKVLKVPQGNVSVQESKDLYEIIQEIYKNTDDLDKI